MDVSVWPESKYRAVTAASSRQPPLYPKSLHHFPRQQAATRERQKTRERGERARQTDRQTDREREGERGRER